MQRRESTQALSLEDLSVTRLSEHNYRVVLAQCPGAAYVAGFRDWLKIGRVVRKGEHGIRILAPLGVRKREAGGDADETKRFKVVYVFDLSQTCERGGDAAAA